MRPANPSVSVLWAAVLAEGLLLLALLLRPAPKPQAPVSISVRVDRPEQVEPAVRGLLPALERMGVPTR